MKSLPRLRPALLRHRLGAEVIIYDSHDDKVHLLDATTACVMELMEEGWTTEGIHSEIASRLGHVPVEGFLELSIAELSSAGLLVAPIVPSGSSIDMVRREAIRKAAMVGAATLLLPAITTLTATKGYAQVSDNRPRCAACTTSSQCAVGNCGTNGACGDSGKPSGVACSGPNQTSANNECCSGTCTSTNGICA